jgi:hypothetical protein
VYEFYWHGQLLATVLVPAISYGAYSNQAEYWYVSPNVAKQMADDPRGSGAMAVKLSQDNDWRTPFTPPDNAVLQLALAAAGWASWPGTDQAAYVDSSGQYALDIACTSTDSVTYYINSIEWFNPTAENFYFDSSSPVGDSLALSWGQGKSFANYYDAPFTQPVRQ